MTLSQAVALVNELRPSEYDKDMLTQWVTELDFMAFDQVYGRAEGVPPGGGSETVNGDHIAQENREKTPEFHPYVYETDAEKQLLIPDQFSSCYTAYLFAKIDFHNAEIERYNMDAMMFEAEWQQFASWYRRAHRPKGVRHEAPNTGYSPLST